MVPGGLKRPADIMKAENLILGSLNYTNQSGLLPHLALNVLGVKHRMIVGFRGGNGVFLAMQRGEVNIHSTSIATFRGRSGGFIKSGEGVGIAYLVPVDKEGRYGRNTLITEMPSFPDLYQGSARPHAIRADLGCVQLAHQPDRRADLYRRRAAAHAGSAGHGAAPGLRRRRARSGRSSASSWRGKGFPTATSARRRASRIFRSLAEVSPDVIRTLHDATKAPN